MKNYELGQISSMSLDCRTDIQSTNSSWSIFIRSFLNTGILSHLEGNNMGCKTTTNPVFVYIQWLWNLSFNDIYSLLLLNFSEHIHLGPKESYRDFMDIWKNYWAFRVSVSGFRCKELILLHYYLLIVNNKMSKRNNQIYLKCKYQLKRITKK